LIDGFWRYEREPVVGRFHISGPIIDIESIGAGGGTIAKIDPVTNRLLVGPESAGADPGPVCYDIGGDRVTVTDCDLALGILDPDYFLGGRMKLNKAKALDTIKKQIAQPLGMDVLEAAAGIFEIITGHMSDLITKQVVASGYVPEEFTIYAFGGAGPVHAAAYSADLGVKKVYVFPTSAVFSAFGIATADIVHTHTQSYRYRMPVDPDRLNKTLNTIEDMLYERLRRENIPREAVEFRRIFHMRYRRQLNELPVVVPTKVYNQEDIQEIIREFNTRFDEVYGTGAGYQEAGIEIISFSVDAVGKMPKPRIKTEKPDGKDSSRARKSEREVFFPGFEKKFIQTRIYEYDLLKPGNFIEGPAIVESPITTVVIPPQVTAEMDIYRNLMLSI
jgi:N-methylhydantoinase A